MKNTTIMQRCETAKKKSVFGRAEDVVEVENCNGSLKHTFGSIEEKTLLEILIFNFNTDFPGTKMILP